MAGTNLVKTLTTKYAKLLGEHEFAERLTEDAIGLDAIIEATNRCDARKKDIDEKLAAIETVIWLFDPDWNPATIRPNYPRKRYDSPGAISRTAYAVLRDAPIPLTTREIARVVVGRLGIECPVERDVARIEGAILRTLSGREGKTVRIMSHKPIRWSIIPRDQARAGTKRSRPDASVPLENEESQRPAAQRYAS